MSEIVTSWPQLVPQRIRSWADWPKDVHDVIWEWNRKKKLRFNYGSRTKINSIPYFQCFDCRRFIQLRGADRCVLNGQSLCEDCLIDRARKEISDVP